MTAIGGYFGLESKAEVVFGHYHQEAAKIHNGRSSLLFILDILSPNRVYVPYYTCDDLLTALNKKNVDWVFYGIDEDFRLADSLKLNDGEYLIYINYWGLQSRYVDELSRTYGQQLIIDNTQAFFNKPSKTNWAFNSCRKFFGVPDGSYLSGPEPLRSTNLGHKTNSAILLDHLIYRYLGQTEKGYEYFKVNEQKQECDYLFMSEISDEILGKIDYEKVRSIRRENFSYLHKALQPFNSLNLSLDADEVPFCYPFLPSREISFKKVEDINIYLPKFWNDCLMRNADGYSFENEISEKLLPLPIDQRYDLKDMNKLLEYLNVS